MPYRVKLIPIPIEHNIPIPPIQYKLGKKEEGPKKYAYPWKFMEIGDSFLMPFTVATRRDVGARISGATARYQCRYVYRTTDKGYRVWRVS